MRWICWLLGAIQGSPVLGHDLMKAGAGIGLCKRCDTQVALNPIIRKIGRDYERKRDHQPYRPGRP